MAPLVLRRCYMGLGRLAFQPGRRAWLGGEPLREAFGAHKVLVSIDGKADFSIALLGWRIGELAIRFDAFPPIFERGSPSMWLHPMHGTAHVLPGQALELELENVGRRPVMVVAGVMGVAMCDPTQAPPSLVAPDGPR